MRRSVDKLKNIFADNSGFSLIELLIAVSLVLIIASGFTSAAVSGSISNRRNIERQRDRSNVVGKMDIALSSTKSYPNTLSEGYVIGDESIGVDSHNVIKDKSSFTIEGTGIAGELWVLENTDVPNASEYKAYVTLDSEPAAEEE